MLEPTMIQIRGFRNADGGYQLRIRLPYYRGLWTNLVDGATVTVDGERTEPSQVRWAIAGRDFSADELATSTDTRWPVELPATLAVHRGEPLAIGFHDLAVELRIRMSYIPLELQPTVWTEQRRLVITR